MFKKIYIWIIVAILAIGNVVLGIFLYKKEQLNTNLVNSWVECIQNFFIARDSAMCTIDVYLGKRTFDYCNMYYKPTGKASDYYKSIDINFESYEMAE